MDLDLEFKLVMDRITKQADLRYLQALARIYNVHFNTVLIWRLLGRV